MKDDIGHTHFDFAELNERERYKLLIGTVVPRPIALVTTVSRAGRANAGPFGGPIAHGFFTLSLMASIVKLPVDLEGVSNGVNYGANKLRFLSPVPVPSTLHARSRLLKAEAKGPGTLLTSEATIHVVGNEKPAVLYEMLTLLM